jgi:ketosteroid isomerase-like protein
MVKGGNQSNRRTTDVESELISQVIATELRWVKAHQEIDLGRIAEILSEGYRQIGSDGSIIRRDQLLESYRSGERRWEIAESSEHDVQIVGNVAILIGRWRGKGVNAGQAFDYVARFLAVYVLENGDWKLHLDVSVPISQ